MKGRRKDEEASVRLRLRATGQRVTPARVRVLSLLEAAADPLSHVEIEARLPGPAVDRVTLYRVLDWLVRNNLARRSAAPDRVWRFSVAGGRHDAHAHFQCNRCGSSRCLNDLPTGKVKPQIPDGYHADGVEITVKGVCARCG